MSGYGAYARHYFAAGWAPLPVPHGRKNSPPTGTTGYAAPMPTSEQIDAWAGADPNANIALRMGPTVVGIDVDGYKGEALETMNALAARLGPLPPTWRSSSKTDGVSGIYFYRLPDDLPAMGDVGPGVETIRFGHRYAIVAPSLHPSGAEYRWFAPDGGPKAPRVEDLPDLPVEWVEHLVSQHRAGKDRGPADTDAHAAEYAALPEDERRRIDAYMSSTISGIMADLRESATWTPGQRDRIGRGWEKLQADKALRLAELALSSWAPISMEEARQVFLDAAPRGGGWTDYDVQAKWDAQARRASAIAMPLATGPKVDLYGDAPSSVPAAPQPSGAGVPAPSSSVPKRPWDDRGIAERALDEWRGRLIYLRDVGSWAMWDGQRWQLGDKETGHRAVQKTLIEAPKREKDIHYADMSWADYGKLTEKTRLSRTVSSAANWLRNTGALDGNLTDFDVRPDLLLVGNGVVDLRTGLLHAGDPSLLLLRGTSVTYDPSASCPEFLRWLEFAQPDPEVRSYLQLVIGASLTGEMVKRYWVHEGARDAGKSMLVTIMSKVIGDLATAINANLITGRDGVYGDDYARAALRGVRLAVLDETREGSHSFDVSIKQLIGGSVLTGRNPSERPFSFQPKFKLHIATNSAPTNRPDPAIASRLEIVRWNVPSTPEIRDAARARLGMTLDAYIEKYELPGVLAWAVGGAMAFYAGAQGLKPPAAVVAATDQHLADGDLVMRWLAERTVEMPGALFTSTNGWQDYRMWQSSVGERSGYDTQRAWGTRMAELSETLPDLRRGSRDGLVVYRGRSLRTMLGVPTTG